MGELSSKMTTASGKTRKVFFSFLLDVVPHALFVVVAQALMDACGAWRRKLDGRRNRGVGGFQVLLHVQHRKPQAEGDVIEAVGRGVFGKIMLQRHVDRQQVVERVFVFDAIEAAENDAAVGPLSLSIGGPQLVAKLFQKLRPGGGIGAFLRRRRHLLLVDLVEDLDPLVERVGVVWLPGELLEIQAAFLHVGAVASGTMIGEEILSAAHWGRQRGRRM